MKPICITFQILTAPEWLRKVADRYNIDPSTGCWEWTGGVDRYGYGKVQINLGPRPRYTGAHRASWIAHRGPLLDNLQLDHLCRNRKCVNPFHLEPVTTQENTRRAQPGSSYAGVKQGRPPIELHARRACARHGTADGSWWTGRDGYTRWRCRPCARDRLAARKSRQS